MRRIRMIVEYDGSPFAGFQRLPAGSPPTVQGELERAVSRILDQETRLKAAGRTDAGVHATGQVVAFDTASPRKLEDLLRGCNAVLPESIRVLRAEEVSGDFHPRFSARSRVYHYYVATLDRPDVFFRERVWWVRGALRVEEMRRAACSLLGSHDFSTYSSRVPPDESRTRDLLRLDIEPEVARLPDGPMARLSGLVRFELEANAFLRRMVRLLVGSLVQVGLGEWEPDMPAAVLRSRNPALAAPAAPPGGLYLVEVRYEGVWKPIA